jgi:hypothetical protein
MIVGHRKYRPDAVGLVYDEPTLGHFLVIEERTDATDAYLEGLAAGCHPETGCDGSWEVTKLASGQLALFISADTVNSLLMIRHGVLFTIGGPPTSFTQTNRLEVANAFDAAAGP